MFCSVVFLALFSLAVIHAVKIKVNPSTHGYVDEFSRTHIFHGVNAVYKIAPWYPTPTGYDATTTLSDIDAKNLKSWGFNIVRLGVMWPGVEPRRGEYDNSYLDQIETIVTNLAKQGIFVILDLHQDLFHRKYCGEGVPDYIYDVCQSLQPPSTKPFPLPVVNSTYPLDSNGDPELDTCLSVSFFKYYLTNEVGAGFQCLYDNRGGVWDNLAGFWVQVAKRFSNTETVLGYELLNEPWMGDIAEDPRRIIPGHTEKNSLQPLYQYLHKAIRSVDDEKIIFYEGLTTDFWPSGFTETPGGPTYNDRQVNAYHIYCPLDQPTKVKELGCNLVEDEFFYWRLRDADRLGGGLAMTEFGASRDIRGDMYQLQKTCERADTFAQSWMYWQFKYYADLTTSTPIGESLYNEDGSFCEDKIKVLSRTYPQIVAGDIILYRFNPETAVFNLTYSPVTTSSAPSPAPLTSSSDPSLQTVIYYNREHHYPRGVRVTVSGEAVQSGAAAFDVSCGAEKTTVTITQSNRIPSSSLKGSLPVNAKKEDEGLERLGGILFKNGKRVDVQMTGSLSSSSSLPVPPVEVTLHPCRPNDGLGTCTCR